MAGPRLGLNDSFVAETATDLLLMPCLDLTCNGIKSNGRHLANVTGGAE